MGGEAGREARGVGRVGGTAKNAGREEDREGEEAGVSGMSCKLAILEGADSTG